MDARVSKKKPGFVAAEWRWVVNFEMAVAGGSDRQAGRRCVACLVADKNNHLSLTG